MQGAVEELYWIGLWTIIAVGLAGIATVLVEWLLQRRGETH